MWIDFKVTMVDECGEGFPTISLGMEWLSGILHIPNNSTFDQYRGLSPTFRTFNIHQS